MQESCRITISLCLLSICVGFLICHGVNQYDEEWSIAGLICCMFCSATILAIEIIIGDKYED